MERIVAALGVAIVGATLSLTVYEAVAGDHSPPDIRLSVRSIIESGNGYRVDFAAVNVGGKTAADVSVEGTLSGANPESSEVTFDFIPPHSERRGGLFFKKQPVMQRLTLRALGYREP